VACDLKSNQIRQTLETFSKRTLRLKIVQHSKRAMPGMGDFGGDRNFELDSEQLSMSNASASEMSQSNRSGRSSSGFSETSKKSRRVESSKMKMRRTRGVKEGSPFEEEYLLELLKEDAKCTEEDKTAVKSLMQVLLYFGMVKESLQIHGLVEKLIRAQLEAECLLSVEQEQFLEKQPEVRADLFQAELARHVKEAKYKKQLDEWENAKCFKH